MTGRLGVSVEEGLRANLDEMIGKHNKLEAETKVLANAIKTLSSKLSVCRDLSKHRLNVVTDLNGKVADLKDTIDELETINMNRMVETRDANTSGGAWEGLAKSRLETIRDRDKVLLGLRHNLEASREANQRLRKQVEQLRTDEKYADTCADAWQSTATKRLQAINDLEAQIKQRDEEMRLLLCDIYKAPDGMVEGDEFTALPVHVAHVAGKADHFVTDLMRGTPDGRTRDSATGHGTVTRRFEPAVKSSSPYKNPDITSWLDYYKQEVRSLRAKQKTQVATIKRMRRRTADIHSLRVTAKIQIATIKRLRLERDVIKETSDIWKRKYHGAMMIPLPVDFSDPTVGANVEGGTHE